MLGADMVLEVLPTLTFHQEVSEVPQGQWLHVQVSRRLRIRPQALGLPITALFSTPFSLSAMQVCGTSVCVREYESVSVYAQCV